MDEPVTETLEVSDVIGAVRPSLALGRNMAPEFVMVSCDGRDLRV